VESTLLVNRILGIIFELSFVQVPCTLWNDTVFPDRRKFQHRVQHLVSDHLKSYTIFGIHGVNSPGSDFCSTYEDLKRYVYHHSDKICSESKEVLVE
jgi:hypothetical protein